MKKILSLLVIAFVLIMTGCSVSNTPEDVAVKFMDALHSCDFEEAMKYCTEKAKGVVELQNVFYKEAQRKEPFEVTDPKVSLISCKISEDGESAVVKVKVENSSVTKGRESEERVNMVKEDGKWLAEYSGK